VSTSFKPNRAKIDSLISKALKESGLKCTVKELVPLDRRYSNNTVAPLWQGYERYVDVESGRTVYVGLTNPAEPAVSVRDKADKFALAKGRKETCEDRRPRCQAGRAQSGAEAQSGTQTEGAPKAEPKPKKAAVKAKAVQS
jgi:hypothetical protein